MRKNLVSGLIMLSVVSGVSDLQNNYDREIISRDWRTPTQTSVNRDDGLNYQRILPEKYVFIPQRKPNFDLPSRVYSADGPNPGA